MTVSAKRPRHGFTLVELLVVFGVVLVLIAILLPSLGKAREAANRTKCMSNLRQVDLAMIMYCNDNKGSFPASADRAKQYREDFIYWQQPAATWDRAIYTGLGADTRDLDHGALVKYMGTHFNAAFWTCPSDHVNAHPKFKLGDDLVSYPYSYTMNFLLSCELAEQNPVAFAYCGSQVVKCQRVRHPATMVLFMEENETTIDDGSTAIVAFDGPTLAQVVPGGTKGTDWISVRHDPRAHQPADVINADDAGGIPNTHARSNVGFCDGHVEWVTREYVQSPQLRHWDPQF